jgi:hypothetical protein
MINILGFIMGNLEYSPEDRLNDILDKILEYGIDSISINETNFLDSYPDGEYEKLHTDMLYSDIIYEDEEGLFKFELETIKTHIDEIHYVGKIYVPDMTIGGELYKGILTGRIINYKKNNINVPHFYKGDYDIFDYCDGIEIELDDFIDSVVDDIKGNSYL